MLRLFVSLAAIALSIYVVGRPAWRANQQRVALDHIESDGWWTNGTVVSKDCAHHTFRYCFDVNGRHYCGDDSTRPCDSVGIGAMVTDLRYWKQDPSANCLGAPSERIEQATMASFGLAMLTLLGAVFLPFLANALITRVSGGPPEEGSESPAE